jgi:Immunity protein 7
MVEYHGWISIHQSLDGEDEEDAIPIMQRLTNYLQSIYLETRLLVHGGVNGTYCINFTGGSNHLNDEVAEILDFLRYVGNVSVGSYGIVFVRNDEASNDEGNHFKVYKLARGKLECVKDYYLSPCNPVIED